MGRGRSLRASEQADYRRLALERRLFRNCTMTALRPPQTFLYTLPTDHSVGNPMLYDRSDLYDIAERIAFAEGRIARLQGRLSRLAEEGSDASRERDPHDALRQSQ